MLPGHVSGPHDDPTRALHIYSFMLTTCVYAAHSIKSMYENNQVCTLSILWLVSINFVATLSNQIQQLQQFAKQVRRQRMNETKDHSIRTQNKLRCIYGKSAVQNALRTEYINSIQTSLRQMTCNLTEINQPCN